MSQTGNNSSSVSWTGVQAYTLAVVCLLLGMAGGWLIRGSQSPASARPRLRSRPQPPRVRAVCNGWRRECPTHSRPNEENG